MNKKIILFILVSLLMFSLVEATFYSSNSDIEVTFLSQDPDPVEPGQIVKVKFKIENEGKETTEDVIIKLNPKFPFSLYNDVAEKNIGKLPATSTGSDAVIVEFKLKVNEKAIEEETELELEIEMGDASAIYVNDDFLIDIQTKDAILDITSITSDPKQIAPGETAEVSIMVKNMADSLLKDIKFKLDFQEEGVPLAPYQSSSERRISQLESGYQNSLKFNVIADPEATPGLYKVSLNITYNDEKGNNYVVKDVLAITIGELPKLKAYIKKSSVLQANAAGKVTLEIANAGSSDIKYLELTLLPSDDYQLVSTTNYYYLGDVDSDDTESEEIDVYINKKVKTLHVPVQLKYTDANNKPFQQQLNLEMNIYSSSELKKFGLVEKSNALIYLLLLIIIVVGFILYRSHKKDPEAFSKKWKRRLSFRKKKK
jgi:hypothetical protein